MKKILSILSLVAVGACATPAAAEAVIVTELKPYVQHQ